MSNYCTFKEEPIKNQVISKHSSKPSNKSGFEDCDCTKYCHHEECDKILDFYKINGRMISKEEAEKIIKENEIDYLNKEVRKKIDDNIKLKIELKNKGLENQVKNIEASNKISEINENLIKAENYKNEINSLKNLIDENNLNMYDYKDIKIKSNDIELKKVKNKIINKFELLEKIKSNKKKVKVDNAFFEQSKKDIIDKVNYNKDQSNYYHENLIITEKKLSDLDKTIKKIENDTEKIKNEIKNKKNELANISSEADLECSRDIENKSCPDGLYKINLLIVILFLILFYIHNNHKNVIIGLKSIFLT